MKRIIFGVAAGLTLGLVILVPGVRADEPGKPAKADPAKELAAIRSEWAKAQQDFRNALGAAKTNEERQELQRKKRPKPAEFADRCLKLAEANPDNPVAVEALAWVVGSGTPAAQKALPLLKEKIAAITDLEQLHKALGGLPGSAFGDLAPTVAAKVKKTLDHPKAVPLLVWVASATLYGGSPELAKLYNDTVDLLMERFVERRELTVLPNWLAQDDNPEWAEKHLRRLSEKNPAADVQTMARFSLGTLLKNKDEASQQEAEKLLQSVAAEPGRLAEQAKRELEDIHGPRALGKPAPEINGDDLDGKAFKLSDYKGKVVLLDFWGFW
ncbi:MAG TPA: hypothetical protein VGY66_16855 [Gemmataceae bacterium]|jgi:hypothetical protein|nr:hypothetical protein [Gemmataceae bacterium]